MSIMLEAFRLAGIVPQGTVEEVKWPTLKVVKTSKKHEVSLMVSGPADDVELYVQEWEQNWPWPYSPSVTWVRADRTRVLLTRATSSD